MFNCALGACTTLTTILDNLQLGPWSKILEDISKSLSSLLDFCTFLVHEKIGLLALTRWALNSS